MLKQAIITAAVALFTVAGVANAQEPRDFSQRPAWFVHLPGTQFQIVFDTPELQVGERRPMKPLFDAIVSWLGANFELPAVQDQPQIRFAPVDQIASFGSRGRSSTGTLDVTSSTSARNQLTAWYDSAAKTIYLPEGWTGASPTELSVLVPQTVRHVQNVSGIEYGCPEARALASFAVQQKWLGIFGLSLHQEFDVNPKLAALSAGCMLLR